MPGECIVTPGYVFGDEALTVEKLNALGNPTVVLGDNSVGPDQLDEEALTDVIGDSLRNTNFLVGGNFEEPTWITGSTPIACPVATDTYRAERFFCRPSGDEVTYERTTTVPNSDSLHAARINGDTGVTTVDFGQNVLRWVAASLRHNITVSCYIYNDTGSTFTPTLRVDTCNSANNFSATTNVYDEELQEIENGEWVWVFGTIDLEDVDDVENGIRVYFRTPNGLMGSTSDHIIFSQFKLELGTSPTTLKATAEPVIGLEAITTPKIADEAVTTDKVADEAVTGDKMTAFVGATEDDDGERGGVPAPDAGDQFSFLRGDGTWALTINPNTCDGRLSLSSTLPVTTSDITSSSLYFHPYQGNLISLYNGSAWSLLSFNLITLAIPNASETMYDVFAFIDSGAVSLETAEWFDSEANIRGYDLTLLNGVWVRDDDNTRRLLGTIRTTAVAGQCADSLALRLLSNVAKPVPRLLRRHDATSSWDYDGVFRPVNGNTANSLQLVQALNYNLVKAHAYLQTETEAAENGRTGIGINSTTVNSAQLHNIQQEAGRGPVEAYYQGYISAGWNTLYWLEEGADCTFRGTYSNGQSGFTAEILG